MIEVTRSKRAELDEILGFSIKTDRSQKMLDVPPVAYLVLLGVMFN